MEKMSLKTPRVNCTDKCLSCPVNVNAFPGKLWKLVNDKNYQSIQWSSCGTTIVINAHHFKEEVLRTGEYSIFKTQNFSSFVRQLNLYGFRKIATTASAKFIDYKTGMRRDCSHPLHCFAHSFFVQHRPDLLSRVRRTSSANKRRLGFHQAEIAYYGQYGNTFRILGRCGQNVASSFIASGSAQTTPSSYVYPSSMTLGSAAQQQFVHATKPSHMPSYTLSSDSESDCSDADDLAEESSNSSALLNKSSAKVLWGQGQHAPGDTSNESSPCSQYSSNLISGAEKGSLGAKQTPAEGVHFPLSLHDAHGQLQKFTVAQQRQSPYLGVPPKAFPESPSLDHLHTDQASSPSFWSPVLGSSRYAMPVGVDQEIYGFQQVFDYSSAQIPYMPVYPSAPYMQYGPTTAVPPENMMSMAYYPSSPTVSSSHSNHGGSSHGYYGNTEEDEDDRDDFPKENFKKVVVKQELKEMPHSYSALVEEGEESSSPQQAHRRFVWNDCDNERERAEMYAKTARQSLYSTEG